MLLYIFSSYERKIIVNSQAAQYVNSYCFSHSVSLILRGHRSSDVALKLTFHVTRKWWNTEGQLGDGRISVDVNVHNWISKTT